MANIPKPVPLRVPEGEPMRLRSLAVTVLFLSCLVLARSGGAQGESGAPPGRNIDPRALVDQLYTVAGKLPIRDMVVELESSDASPDTGNLVPAGKDKIYYKYPNKLRVDSIIRDPGGPLDEKQVIIIRDGVNMWHFVSMGQYPVKKAPDTPRPTLNLPFNIQRYPQDGARNYELAAPQVVEGVRTEVVRITNPQVPRDVRTVYVDVQRNVPLRLEMEVPGEKGGAPTQLRVEYRDIRVLEDGRYLPFTLEIYEGNSLQRVRVYKGVKVNVGLQDSLFQPMSGLVR